MSNSENSNLEDVPKRNSESDNNDSTSNKKTRFTKSKSISEVFRDLEINDGENPTVSNDFDNSSADEIVPVRDESDGIIPFHGEEDGIIPVHGEEDGIIPVHDDLDYEEDSLADEFDTVHEEVFDSSEDDEVDEIIPIHNEYKDLDKSEASDLESVEGGIILNPDLDDSAEANVKESKDYDDSLENTDSINTESKGSVDMEENEEDAYLAEKDSDHVLADEDIEEKLGKSSAQGVIINDKDKADSKKSSKFGGNFSLMFILDFLLGLIVLFIGITYYASSSDRVVDNVLSGETAGLAIIIIIIGLIIIGFALLRFFSSSKSSFIIDTFNSIKSIDYDEVSEDSISREDFDAVFGIFKRKKDSNFSDDDDSVDSSKDLFENQDDDEDMEEIYPDSDSISQKDQSSFNGHDDANSTELSNDYDDGVDEIIRLRSQLNEQSNDDSFDEPSLDDKYSKYDFEEDSDDYSVGDSVDYMVEDDSNVYSVEEDYAESSLDDKYSKYDFEEDSEDFSVKGDSINDYNLFEENSAESDNLFEDNSNDDFDLFENNQSSIVEDSSFENNQASIVEDKSFEENLDALEDANDYLDDKYAKYDFDDEEAEVSKPKFKKSVDLSKYEREELTEEELAEKARKAEELAEKKRRIIEGTNFDNSLRKE